MWSVCNADLYSEDDREIEVMELDKLDISVIMGIYNCEKTLEESIDSLLDQTYKNFELIMCDDGSKDKTYDIAKQYEKKYPEIIHVYKNTKNMGLNYTLNKCLKYAKGKYIARQDGDDISLPVRFEREIDYLKNNNEFSIVSCPMIYFDGKGDWGQGTVIENPQKKDFVRHAPFFCHAPSMIRKEAIDSVGGYTVDKRLLRYEDCNLWYKLYGKGYKGHNLKEPLYKMRDDRDATARRDFSSRLRAVYVQYTGFRIVDMPFKYYFYLPIEFIKNFLLAILPLKIYEVLHKKKKNN